MDDVGAGHGDDTPVDDQDREVPPSVGDIGGNSPGDGQDQEDDPPGDGQDPEGDLPGDGEHHGDDLPGDDQDMEANPPADDQDLEIDYPGDGQDPAHPEDIEHDNAEGRDPDDDDPESDGDMEHEQVNDYFDILKYLSKEWLELEVNHRVSKVASEAMWDLAKTWFPKLFEMKNVQGISRKTPSFGHIRKQLYLESVPPIHMELAYLEKETGDITIVEDTPVTPKGQYPSHRYQKMWEISHVKVT